VRPNREVRLRVLVATIVHTPADARIYHRQIRALRQAGHQITFMAPFTSYNVRVPDDVTGLDVPRASGTNRLRANLTAGRLLRQQAPQHDITLIHDPELLLAASNTSQKFVWDVHEDTAAAVSMKSWIPKPLSSMSRFGTQKLEQWAENHLHIILAEDGYRSRFRLEHPVVPNTTSVPRSVELSGDKFVIYLGSITRARGAFELVEMGKALRRDGVTVRLVGNAESDLVDVLSEAHAQGFIDWHGFIPNDSAVTMLNGALAGISPLHDEDNYRRSRPTKVIEYMAHGVAVISTPNPPAVQLISQFECGKVVPYKDSRALVDAVLELRDDSAKRQLFADNGHHAALTNFNWDRDQVGFVQQLEDWAH